MITVRSTPELAELEQQWREAKSAEKQWNAHRLLLEAKILEAAKPLTPGAELPDKGKVRLDSLDITFAKTRSFNQGILAQVINDFAWLRNAMFKTEYKCTSNPTLDKFIAEDDDEGVGERLKGTFQDKPSKPSFSAR